MKTAWLGNRKNAQNIKSKEKRLERTGKLLEAISQFEVDHGMMPRLQDESELVPKAFDDLLLFESSLLETHNVK